MAFNRHERTLSAKKSRPSVFRKGVPDNSEGYHEDVIFAEIDGIGIVQYIKINNAWRQVISSPTTQAELIKTIRIEEQSGVGAFNEDDFIKHDGSVKYTGHQSHGGFNITEVNDLAVQDDVTIGDDLDVDGATTLDATSINTTDGVFSVSGANNTTITTTGSADITLTSADRLEFSITGVSDWNTTDVDWDTTRDFDLTGSGDITIEAVGTSASKLLVQNTNEHASAFDGVHIKTDSGGTSNVYNLIKIECDGIATKGGSYGIDFRSENNIRIRAEDANDNSVTGLLMRASGPVDIGGGTDDITAHTTTSPEVYRTKIHGVCEVQTLWRPEAADDGGSPGTSFDTVMSPINCSEHDVKFDQIDTFKLIRATTYHAAGTIAQSADLEIVSAANDFNATGTVWMITVYWAHSSGKENLQVWWCYAATSGDVNLYQVKVVENLVGGTTAATLDWTDAAGIVWTNEDSQDAVVKASALRIQISADF